MLWLPAALLGSAKRWRALAEAGRDESGAVLIETTLGFLSMMLMLFVVMECCMMGYTYSLLTQGAKEGVRYACVHGVDSASCSGPSTGCDATAANVISAVRNSVSGVGANVTGMRVTVSYPDGSSVGTSRVQVNISYNYQPLTRFGARGFAFSTSSTGRIMY